METDGDASRMTASLLQQVFELADDADHTLPTSSALFRKLLRGYFKDRAGRLDSSLLIHEACRQLWARLATTMECRPPDGWVSTVVTSLFTLAAKDRRQELAAQMWRAVAHPAEEKQDSGLGRDIMREVSAEEQTGAGRLALMGFAISTLRRGGHPPGAAANAPSQPRSNDDPASGEEQEDGLILVASQRGLRLALSVASLILEAFLGHDDEGAAVAPREPSAAAFEEWRWDLHLEVSALMRASRLEDVGELVLTVARPLYHGWANPAALEDVRSWIIKASSGGENIELHLALLCILVEDLRPILDVRDIFGLIYSGVSSGSSLCQRRGLHVLQQLLAWAEEAEGRLADDEDDGGREQPATSEPAPRSQRSPGGVFSREELQQWKDYARCLEVLCEETELHLIDQVVPIVERLCSTLLPTPPPSSPPPPATTAAAAALPSRPPPRATEFRWVSIPLGMLVQSGTFARRRKFLYRVVTRDLGLGGRQPVNGGNGDEDEGGRGRGDGGGHAAGAAGTAGGVAEDTSDGRGTAAAAALAPVEEAWMARVLLPALDQVGWHSSTALGSLRDFSEAVTDFLRCYVRALPTPRVTAFLTLLLEAIRERTIGSIGGLCAVLAAFQDPGGDATEGRTRGGVPAMGRDVLFQLKEMLLVVLPPLNQAKRVLFLDGIVRLLLGFTDYGELALSVPSQPASSSLPPPLPLVASILSALPLELVRDRYLSQLATWVAGFSLGRRPGTAEDSTDDRGDRGNLPAAVATPRSRVGEGERESPWLMFARRLEAFLGRRRSSGGGHARGDAGLAERRGISEGRHLCLLGLVLSEGFAIREDRDQVLANGLSPLVQLLRQCWHEPYVAADTVQAALVLFSAWAAVSDVRVDDGGGGGDDDGSSGRGEKSRTETRRWRWRPLEAVVSEVVTLVTTRLSELIELAAHSSTQSCSTKYGGGNTRSHGGGDSTGRDAHTLLTALDAAAAAAATADSFSSHSGVVGLGDRCASFLSSAACIHGGDGSGAPHRLSPTAHLLAIASLEIIVRPRAGASARWEQGQGGGGDRGGGDDATAAAAAPMVQEDDKISWFLPAAARGWDGKRCRDVVLSLLQNKVEGRVVTSSNGHRGSSTGKGSTSDWGSVLKQHELRKWSCLSALLPAVLYEPGATAGDGFSIPVCDALVEGIRMSSREEMPQAMSCFRVVFPAYVRALPAGQGREAGFTGVFEAVWGVFAEVRRPQLPLVRDLISAVLHPSLLAMPELNGVSAAGDSRGSLASPDLKGPSSSPMVDAFSTILDFSAANNKPNVLRAVVGGLTVHGRRHPGALINLVPGLVELLLFKEWGQGGIETLSNDEGSSATAAEAPRFLLLLFIEQSLIPSAASGSQDSRLVLRAMTLRLMELQASKEFRQCSITDPTIYGRKLRGWQALCVLCGYFCDTTSYSGDSQVLEVVDAISSWFWPVHGRTTLPPIRQHMEIFAVRMCRAYPDVFLTAVVKELKDYRLPGQVLCSLLIITGHTLFLGKDVSSISARHRVQMFEACLPWMVGTHVMGRLIAQLVCHSVLPDCVAAAAVATGVAPARTAGAGAAAAAAAAATVASGADHQGGGADPHIRVAPQRTHLETLFLFLHDNPEMIKMRQRQLEAFGQTDCVAMCTVEGMLEAHGTRGSSTGDITPTHMCELLKETMDEIWNEALNDKTATLEDGRSWLQTAAAVKSGAWFEEDGDEERAGEEEEETESRRTDGSPERPLRRGDGGGDGCSGGNSADGGNVIQQKIIPWDKLDLTVASAASASLERSTAAGRTRQPVVMCASLVDKVPNIAGLARTSEIFAAAKLIVPDKRILKNPAFPKISTGAEQWLPVEEVGEKQLVAWLRRLKKRSRGNLEGAGARGKQILVGVEQTNNSICLTKMKFQRHLHYTLVLGRENSGLPLEVLSEMDVCCQIPQQGVLRSLNAHVSGAIILAEYSRQMLV